MEGEQRRMQLEEHYCKVDHLKMYYNHQWKYDRQLSVVLAELQQCYFSTDEPVALDIGCSIGRYEKALARNELRFVGIDVAWSALIEAHRNVPGANFTMADAINMPFKNESFDLVLCIEVLHHFTDSFCMKILDEVRRVIKPGGYFLFDIKNKLNPVLCWAYNRNDDINFTLRARTISELSELLDIKGFKVVRKKGILFPIALLAPYVICCATKGK